MKKLQIPLVALLAAIGCGKSKSLGSSTDSSGGAPAQSAGRSMGGQADATAGRSMGGQADGPWVGIGQPRDPGGGSGGIHSLNCSTPKGTYVTPEEFDYSAFPVQSEEECSSYVAGIEEGDRMFVERPDLDVAPLAGTWTDGAGSNRIELVLDRRGQGTLLFGEERALPAISDPHEPYLIDVGEKDWGGFEHLSRSPSWTLAGFRYAVLPVSGRGSEMTFTWNAAEPWTEWCSLQMPVQSSFCYSCELWLGSYTLAGAECDVQGCIQQDTSNPPQLVMSHCGRLALCSNACLCDSESCRMTPLSGGELMLTVDPVDTSVVRLKSAPVSTETRYLQKINP